MTATPEGPAGARVTRFPGFDVLKQEGRWDPTTRAVISKRMHPASALRFFTATECETVSCLLDHLMGQDQDSDAQRIPLVEPIDERLADDLTDGWNFDTMPPDREAWRASLAALDADARTKYSRSFAECSATQQRELIESVRTKREERWHGLPPGAVWSLWTRYAATAYYSHPAAWNEIGFDGPAYPRGYKNIGIDRLEGIEVRDADPGDDPVRGEITS
jgi:hypothetical protein